MICRIFSSDDWDGAIASKIGIQLVVSLLRDSRGRGGSLRWKFCSRGTEGPLSAWPWSGCVGPWGRYIRPCGWKIGSGRRSIGPWPGRIVNEFLLPLRIRMTERVNNQLCNCTSQMPTYPSLFLISSWKHITPARCACGVTIFIFHSVRVVVVVVLRCAILGPTERGEEGHF